MTGTTGLGPRARFSDDVGELVTNRYVPTASAAMPTPTPMSAPSALRLAESLSSTPSAVQRSFGQWSSLSWRRLTARMPKYVPTPSATIPAPPRTYAAVRAPDPAFEPESDAELPAS